MSALKGAVRPARIAYLKHRMKKNTHAWKNCARVGPKREMWRVLSLLVLSAVPAAWGAVVNINFDVPRQGEVCVAANVGDQAKFYWSELHNLNELYDETKYEKCQFGGATQLAPSGPKPNGIMVDLTAAGDRYFACSKICKSNDHKVKICVGASTCTCAGQEPAEDGKADDGDKPAAAPNSAVGSAITRAGLLCQIMASGLLLVFFS